MKNKVTDYILYTYGVEPDFPFASAPETTIFRNIRNRKWFAALLGSLPKRCLGLDSSEKADVLNLKCDPIMTYSLIDNQKIFRAYHMNKEHWSMVKVGKDADETQIMQMVYDSYQLTKKKTRKKK